MCTLHTVRRESAQCYLISNWLEEQPRMLHKLCIVLCNIPKNPAQCHNGNVAVATFLHAPTKCGHFRGYHVWKYAEDVQNIDRKQFG